MATLVAACALGALAAGFAYACYQADEPAWHVLGSFFALLGAGLAADLLVRHQPFATGSLTVRLPGRLRRRAVVDVGPLIARWGPAAFLLAVALHVVWPVARTPPFSHDHPVHLFNAWHFWTEMLGRGRLRGWSHYGAFGFPTGEFMPWGPDLWVALFRTATAGTLSWTRTYGIALAGALIFSTMAIHAFTRRFFGATAGVIAGLLWLLDPGAWAEGGWHWHTTFGVWPITLAMSFVLLALAKLVDLARAGSRWDALGAAFWIFAALVTHLLPLIVFAVTVPLLLLARALRRDGLGGGGAGRDTGAPTRGLIGAVAIGFGLAAFQIVPMLTRSGFTRDLGVPGISLADLARRLIEGQVFEALWSPVYALGLLGGIHAVRHRGPGGLFVAAAAALFVVLSSDILISIVHAERLLPSIVKVEARRMLLVARLLWFVLAAHAAASVVRLSMTARPRFQTVTGILVCAALAAPILRPAFQHLARRYVDKEIQAAAATPYWGDLLPLLQWSRAERARTPGFFRIAYALPMHDHLSAGAPVWNGIPMYKVGYTPAQEFRSFPMTDEPELYEALSVKYVVADRPLAREDLVLDRTFGQLHVYRFTRHRPQPFTLIGAGQADLLRFDPESVELRLQGTAPGSRLKLHVAHYPPWEATIDGRAVPISPATVHGAEYPFLMEIPARDGRLVFRYVRRAADWAGLALTVLALAAAATSIAAGAARRAAGGARWAQAARRALAALRAIDRPARIAAVGGILLLGGLGARRLIAPTRVPADSLFALLPSAGGQLTLAEAACAAREPAASWRCGPHELRAAVVAGDYGSHLCLTAPPVGPLRLAASIRLGRFIEGRYDPYGGQMDGTIRASVHGEPLGTVATRRSDQGLQLVQFDTRRFAGQTARLEIELAGGPLHCFDFRVIH